MKIIKFLKFNNKKFSSFKKYLVNDSLYKNGCSSIRELKNILKKLILILKFS